LVIVVGRRIEFYPFGGFGIIGQVVYRVEVVSL
jgi:hypothetical protein